MKRFICIILCIVLIISAALCCSSFAAENDDSSYLMYSCLTDNQKAVYNAVKENPFAYNVSGSYPYPNAITVTLDTPLTYTAGYTGPTDDSDSDALEIIAAGLYAFAYDHPQYFWFSGFANNQTYTSELLENGYTYETTITGYTIYPFCKSSAFSSKQDLIDKTNEMIDIVASSRITGYTRYEKIKSIHDIICSLANYNTNTNAYPLNRNTHGLFLPPNTAVCESYASAFKMLCDKAGIPCIVVIGKYQNGGHAWNYVKMDDGKWYAVDCTFDDSNNGIEYYYFLSSADSPDYRSTTGETFSQTHINDGKLSFFTDFSFTYPELEPTPYASFYLGSNSKAVYLKDKNYLIIPANSVLGEHAMAPTNTFFMAMSDETGTKVNLMSFQTFEQTYCFTIIMRGDVVINGITDADDYEKVRAVAVKTDSIDRSLPQYTAADMNGDGVIDAFDMFSIDRAINELPPPD